MSKELNTLKHNSNPPKFKAAMPFAVASLIFAILTAISYYKSGSSSDAFFVGLIMSTAFFVKEVIAEADK